MRFLLSLALLVAGGVAARQLKQQTAEVFVPREAITKVEMAPDGYCSGPDLHHLHCKGLKMTVQVGKTQIRVVTEEVQK